MSPISIGLAAARQAAALTAYAPKAADGQAPAVAAILKTATATPGQPVSASKPEGMGLVVDRRV